VDLIGGLYMNKKTYTLEAVEYLAKTADGGMREALSLLETALGYSKTLTVESVTKALNVCGYEDLFELLGYLINKDRAQAIKKIEDVYMSGKELKTFFKQFLSLIMDVMKYQFYKDFKYIKIPNQFKSNLDSIEVDLNKELVAINSLCNNLKNEQDPKLIAEVSITILCGV
jgi:DNA polymerase-3 subunit gamma/tau